MAKSTLHAHVQKKRITGPILVIDDNSDEAKLAKLTIETVHPAAQVSILNSGSELMEYLAGDPPCRGSSSHPVPSLILLDLRMPEITGFEVLEWLMQRPSCAGIPVVVFSGYDDPSGIKRAYALNARAYLFKPVAVESIRSVISSIGLVF